MLKKALIALALGQALLVAPAAFAAYPERPITLIVPAAAGGAADTLSRIVGNTLSKELGQPVVVQNKPGAAAAIGMTELARAKNDGYTLGMVFAGAMAVNPNLYKSLRYNPEKDFDPISLVAISPLIITVNTELGIKTIQDLVAYSKKNPEKITFGSAGVGSTQHLCMELFKVTADANMMHVPYTGTAPATMDLLSGVIPVMCDNVISISPQFKTGKIAPLAVTTAERLSAFKDVPTVAESGYPGFQASGWYGMVAPAGTDPAIVERISKIVNQMIRSESIQKELIGQGMVPKSNTPQEFRSYIKEDRQKWGEVVKRAGIEPQ